MKITTKQLKALIESVLNENDDPFVEKLKSHDMKALKLIEALKKEIVDAGHIAKKAKQYGTPSGDKLQQYDTLFKALHDFIDTLKHR